MKNKFILSGFAALSALATTASADVTIDITGATAFRTAAIDAIIAAYGGTGSGTGLTDFAHTGTAASLSSLQGARQSIFRGNLTSDSPNQGIVTIRCTWTGSVEGIQTVGTQVTQDFLPVTALDVAPPAGGAAPSGISLAHTQGTVSGVGNLAAGTELIIPDLAFSDVFPSSSPFDVSNVGDDIVGVVVFTMIANEGAPAGLTNVTGDQFRTLFSSGSKPLNYFFPTTDTRNVYATGRSDFSGTRTTYLAVTGFSDVVANKVSPAVQQWKPTLTGSANPTFEITTLRLWPTNDGNNRSLVWGTDLAGNGGFESSSSLRTAFQGFSTNVTLQDANGVFLSTENLLLVSCFGISDATTAVAGGAKALSYNGVGITPANPLSAADRAKITEGAYTLWGYQHLMHNSLNYPAATQAVKTVLIGGINSTTIGTAGIAFNLMNVSRNDDGATVAP